MLVKSQRLIQKQQSACSLDVLTTQQPICCKTKTRQIFTSRKIRFNEYRLPGFENEKEQIEDSFLLLDLDSEDVRIEPQDTSELSELSSEVEITETESIQESQNVSDTEIESEVEQAQPASSTRPKPASNVKFNPKVAVKTIEPKPSKIPVPVKRQEQKTKNASRLQLIGKLGQMALPAGDEKLQLWHEYDEMKRQRKEAVQEKDVQRSDRSRRPPECYGKSYSHAAQCLTSQMILEPETLKM